MAEPAGRGVLANRIRCQAAVRRVGPDEIVVEPPAFDDGAGLGETGEDLLVQALVAQPAVEALDEAVLLRFARGDLAPSEAGAIGPFEDGAAGHLGAVVAGDDRGLAAAGDERVERAR